jgi:hypothetical protein
MNNGKSCDRFSDLSRSNMPLQCTENINHPVFSRFDSHYQSSAKTVGALLATPRADAGSGNQSGVASDAPPDPCSQSLSYK